MQSSLFESKLRPLRPRQANAIEQVRDAIRQGHKRIILQAPTGFGKTLTAAHIIAGALDKGKRPLFTCPAITLVDQTLKAFEAEGIADIGIMQAQHIRTDPTRRLQIASVQTLVRREMPDIDFLLIDEVHESFDKLNEKLDGPWRDRIAIGLSATPWLKGMGLRWTKLVVAASIEELIEESYLSPFHVFVPAQDFDRKALSIQRGEFTEASSQKAMSDGTIIGNIVETWKEHELWKTFMFCVNRAHAKEQMGAFWDHGIPFGYIDALTTMTDRTKEFERMRAGDIAGIASVGCLIRGVDEDVRCIIDAQPTRSEMRHVQKIGRGLRTAQGKAALIVLDHAGNTLDLGLVTDIVHEHLDTGKEQEKTVAFEGDKKPSKPAKCRKCYALIEKGRALCHVCGAPVTVTSDVEHVEGELVAYGSPKREKKSRDYSMQEKQEWYSGFLYIAQQRGKQQGWAAHRYREKFGVWPNQLKKIALHPALEIQQWDQHQRIKWAKSKERQNNLRPYGGIETVPKNTEAPSGG